MVAFFAGLVLFALLIAIGLAVILIGGIIILCIGIRKRRKATGEAKPKALIIVGAIITGVALFCNIVFWGDTVIELIRDRSAKCVTDKWRIHDQVNAAQCVKDMSDEILMALDEGDQELFIMNFTESARESRGFENDVDELFDECDEYDLDPGSINRWNKKRIDSDYEKDGEDRRQTAAYVLTSEDGEYSIYLDICIRNDSDKDEIGINKFYICTSDTTGDLDEYIDREEQDSIVKFFK